jgi:uncharacterized membrane protein
MSRSLSVMLVCVLLVGTVLVGGFAVGIDQARPTDDAEAGERDPAESVSPPLAVATQGEFARSTFEIEVFRNGSARWTFLFVRPLANDSEREQFRTFADRFESEETDFYRTYRERSRALTRTASNTTGREMTARNFSRSARVVPPGNRGIVEVSFVWTNLGVVEDDGVRIADIFAGGFYIAGDQWLVFEAGPGLAFDAERTEPTPDEVSGSTLADSETLTWIGEQQFTDNHPRVVLVPAQETTDSGGTGPTTTGESAVTRNTSAGGNDGSDSSFPMMLAGLVVLVVGLAAGAVWRSGAFGSTTTDSGSSAGAAETADAEAADTDAAAAGGAAATSSEPAVPDEELLTDEDRVLQMLEDNGGRMKQANIVDETGWSKSKVSMLLSDMEDEGDISKLRVGRENIVSLKGHEPDAAGSPFDDDS